MPALWHEIVYGPPGSTPPERPPFGNSTAPGGALAILVVAGVIIYGLYAVAPIVYQAAVSFLGKRWLTAALVTLSVLCASMLFWLRERRRMTYAMLELAFGFVSVWKASTETVASSENWPLILAAIYIIVRGFDNVKVGMEQRYAKKTKYIHLPT